MTYRLGRHLFLSRQFEETRRQIHIIPTLVYQLARRSRSYAHALHESDKFDSADKLTEQMENLFIGPWEKSKSQRHTELPPYLIIVDALDEIEAVGGPGFIKTQDHIQDNQQDVLIEHIESDITKDLHVKLPNFAGKPELETAEQLAGGLFISAATIVRYLTPRPLVTVDEQCKLLRKLQVRQSFSASGTRRPLLIHEFYQQILRDDDLFDSRLCILHTFLCTFERASTSLTATLLAESDELRSWC